MPRSHPEELHYISLADRLNRMEQRMEEMMHLLDKTVAENSLLKETVVSITNNSSPLSGGGIKECTRPDKRY